MSEVTIKIVFEELFESISNEIDVFGFRFNKTKKRLSRIDGDNKQEIQFIFDNSSQGVLLTVMLYVTNNKISAIYESATGEESPWHLGIDILKAKKFYEEGVDDPSDDYSRFMVSNYSELCVLNNVVSDYIEKYAIRYFRDSNTQDKVNQLLNMNPIQLTVHNKMYPARATIALIAAFLSKDPRLLELADIYRKETNDANPHFKERFEKVRDYIEQMMGSG